MKPLDIKDIGELLLLAAIWGGSFLFQRMGASDFSPMPLAFLRGAGACVLLLPMLLWRGEWAAMRRYWWRIALVGITNSAIPFMCFAYAALAMTAGLSAIFNATTPLWTAVIAWLWLRDRLTRAQVLGLMIGFAGVAWLAMDQAAVKTGLPNGVHPGWATLACILATMLYGFSANYTKRMLQGIPSMALAAGSQLSTALALALPALYTWPSHSLPLHSWLSALALALLCTGVAYVLFFRLIVRIGPPRAISVTYLIPIFASLWGLLFLGEKVTPVMLGACLVILLGTALTTGFIGRKAVPLTPAQAPPHPKSQADAAG